MFSKFNIKELFYDGLKLLKGESKLMQFILLHLIVPVIVAFCFFHLNVKINQDFVSNIISSISIFSGLLFSVIFILTENYSRRKNYINLVEYNKENNKELEGEYKKYIERYRQFTNDTSTLILFSVVLAILIVLTLLLLNIVDKTSITSSPESYIRIIINKIKEVSPFSRINKEFFFNTIQTISYILLFNYLLTILIIVKEVYAMVYDDINNSRK